MEILFKYIKDKFTLIEFDMWVEFYESRKKYPNLIGTEYESYLFNRWEIRFKNLTHKTRKQLLEELEKSNLRGDQIPFEFYSES